LILQEIEQRSAQNGDAETTDEQNPFKGGEEGTAELQGEDKKATRIWPIGQKDTEHYLRQKIPKYPLCFCTISWGKRARKHKKKLIYPRTKQRREVTTSKGRGSTTLVCEERKGTSRRLKARAGRNAIGELRWEQNRQETAK